MSAREISLSTDAAQIERLVRILGASVNVEILRVLIEARARDEGGGWLFLSEIAAAIDEKPGTVGLAVQKLLPLLEEKRTKGKRYFRSRVRSLKVLLDSYPVRGLL